MSSDLKVKNAKYFTVVAELADIPLCIIQKSTQQMHFSSAVQSLLPIGSYALPRLMVPHNED